MEAFGRHESHDYERGSERHEMRRGERGSRRPEPTVLHSVGEHLQKRLMSTSGSRRHSREGFEDATDPSFLFVGLLFLVLLVFALSPGVLLTLPPGRGGIFMSGTTSTLAALVHAFVIVFILYLI